VKARRSCASQVCIRIERVSANVASVLAKVVGTSFPGGVSEGSGMEGICGGEI
jgi:hypothetical protein